jgi:hypothetical protein
MKNFKALIIGIFLISSVTSFEAIMAQEQPKAEQERQAEIQRAIDDQKKAMNEQRRAQERANREIRDNLKEMEQYKNFQFDVQTDSDGNNVRVYRRGKFSGAEPFIFSVPDAPDVPDVPMFYGHSFGGDDERTTWEFSKSLKENSFKKEYTFDVDKTAKSVVMSVSGDCRAGEIRIKILTPNGKSYSDTVIDEFGNINVRKSFRISEKENQDKTGEWKFVISSDKATGFFKLSLQIY